MEEDGIWQHIEGGEGGPASEIDFDERVDRYRQSRTLLALDELQKQDVAWKLNARKEYSNFFKWFLIIQNSLVLFFVFVAYYNSIELDNLDSFFRLQPIVSVLIGGTIIQTILIIKIMVRWIFSNSSYKMNPYNKQQKIG